MRLPRSAAAGTLALLALGACGERTEQPAPRGYAPGLGEIMTLTQMRHLKLGLAIEAQNFDLASYEVDELEEGFADAVAFHPTHENAPRPLAEMLPEYTEEPVAALRTALAERDAAALASAYDALTAGCNGCHEAAHFGFNRVVRPAANPYSNQAFGAKEGDAP